VLEAEVADDPCGEALEGLGWAHYWLDDIERSIALREKACRCYRDDGRCRDAARVATALALDELDIHGLAVANGWFELARRCLTGIEDCPEHGWLVLWEGHMARMVDGDCDRARQLGAEASEVGRVHGQADLEVLGDALVGLVEVNEGKVDAGMRRLDASMAAAMVGELHDLYSVSAACCFLLHACEWVRDYERMAQWTTRVDRFADDWNIRSMFTACRTQHAALLIGRGMWSDAEAQLQRINEELMTTRPWFAPEALEQLGDLRRRQGRFDEAVRLFERAGSRAVAMLGRAWIALDQGRPAEALELGERALRALTQARWADTSTAMFVVVRAHLGVNAPEHARVMAAELQQTSTTFGAAFSLGLSHHAAGLIAAQARRHEDAKAHFVDALAAFESACAPYEAARARVDLAGTLEALDLAQSAHIELDLAGRAFDALGAQVDADRCRGQAAPDPSPGVLTPRERQVLDLISEGLGDKAIARDLGISGHTVHRHIANILEKLDKPTRASAVAYALRHQLI
jgi:DNA-binding CsgD family transcriptional regulator